MNISRWFDSVCAPLKAKIYLAACKSVIIGMRNWLG